MPRPRGDYKKLDKLIRASGRIVSKELLRKTAKTFGTTSFDLARRGAQAGTNPAGRRWRRLKKTRGIALRKMAGSLHLQVRATGFTINSSERTAKFHQGGASKRGTKWRLPKRSILPKRSLPKPWRNAVNKALQHEWYGNFTK